MFSFSYFALGCFSQLNSFRDIADFFCEIQPLLILFPVGFFLSKVLWLSFYMILLSPSPQRMRILVIDDSREPLTNNSSRILSFMNWFRSCVFVVAHTIALPRQFLHSLRMIRMSMLKQSFHSSFLCWWISPWICGSSAITIMWCKVFIV